MYIDDPKYRYVDYWCPPAKWKRLTLAELEPIIKRGNTDCFSTIQHFADPVRGESGVQRHLAPLYFDLDSEDLELARAEAVTLLNWMMESFDLQESWVRVWFSGKKGFHLIVDHRVFDIKPHEELTKILKNACLFIGKLLEMQTLDTRVYTKARQWRLPDSIHSSTKLHCVELTHEELELSVEEIQELAKEPRGALSDPGYDVEPLGKEWFSRFVKEYDQQKSAELLRPKKAIGRCSGDPVCIQDLRKNSIRLQGTRNSALLSLISYYKEQEMEKGEVIHILEQWSEGIPSHLSASDESERKAQVRANVEWMYNEDNTFFSCSHIRSLGAGSDRPIACEWDKCPHVNPGDQEPASDILLDLKRANSSSMLKKRVAYNSYVQSIEETPYIVPGHIKMTCSPDLRKRACQTCKYVSTESGEFSFGSNTHHILKFIGADVRSQNKFFREAMKISDKCPGSKFEQLSHVNIMPAVVEPVVEFRSEEAGDLVTRNHVYFLGKDTAEVNMSYQLSGITHAHPRTGAACQIIDRATPMNDHYTNFEMTEELHERLRKFQPTYPGLGGLLEKENDIQQDRENNVHHIRGRRNMGVATDLVFHSVSGFHFLGKGIPRGWVEILIVGDTSQGKSELVNKMLEFYEAGHRLTAENMSGPGMIGTTYHGKDGHWQIAWGALPKNDRGLVVIDECHEKGKSEVLGLLTDVRSSGVARIEKAARGQAAARVRKFFIANPPHKTQTESHYFPCLMANGIFPSPEDIRRLDLMLVLRAKDIDARARFIKHTQAFNPKYGAAESKALVAWCWSRTAKQVKWDTGVEEMIIEEAELMCKKYHHDLPLVEKGDQQHKIARLAIACAGKHYSTEDGQHLIVRKEHVERVSLFLQEEYDSEAMGYKDYSVDRYEITDFKDEDEFLKICERIKQKCPMDMQELMRVISREEFICVEEIAMMWDGEESVIKSVIKTMAVNNLLSRMKGKYKKTNKGVKVVRFLMRDTASSHLAEVAKELFSAN